MHSARKRACGLCWGITRCRQELPPRTSSHLTPSPLSRCVSLVGPYVYRTYFRRVDLHFAKDRSYVEFATKNQAIFQHNASAGKHHHRERRRDMGRGHMDIHIAIISKIIDKARASVWLELTTCVLCCDGQRPGH